MIGCRVLRFTYEIDVFIVREADSKFREGILTFFGDVEYLRRIREWMSRAVPRRWVCMTDPTYDRLGSDKELLAMTANTVRVFGIVRHIRKCTVTGAHFVPVGGWNFVTRVAGFLVLRDAVGKLRIIWSAGT